MSDDPKGGTLPLSKLDVPKDSQTSVTGLLWSPTLKGTEPHFAAAVREILRASFRAGGTGELLATLRWSLTDIARWLQEGWTVNAVVIELDGERLFTLRIVP